MAIFNSYVKLPEGIDCRYLYIGYLHLQDSIFHIYTGWCPHSDVNIG